MRAARRVLETQSSMSERRRAPASQPPCGVPGTRRDGLSAHLWTKERSGIGEASYAQLCPIRAAIKDDVHQMRHKSLPMEVGEMKCSEEEEYDGVWEVYAILQGEAKRKGKGRNAWRGSGKNWDKQGGNCQTNKTWRRLLPRQVQRLRRESPVSNAAWQGWRDGTWEEERVWRR